MTSADTSIGTKHRPFHWSAVLVAVWSATTILWSIFNQPERTYPVRILLFQPAWLIRQLWRDDTRLQDLAITLSVHAAFASSTSLWNLSSLANLASIDFSSETHRLYLTVFSLLGVCGAFAGVIVYRESHLELEQQNPARPIHRQTIDEHPIPPVLMPSRTTHSRLFPKKHSFGYSYFLVGVPVGVNGKLSSGLSVDSARKGWFDVSGDDFLIRAHSGFLNDKLRAYLHTQGVTDRDYSFAYLVTAPRFAGYSFNPVSFWYIYDEDARLKYMILEVNNTFDERRLYLLRADSTSAQLNSNPSDLTEDEPANSRQRLVFTETWPKDFHVSPFNSRKGSYSLRAIDPLVALQETGHVSIDNTIVLRSSQANAKIVARVWSDGQPKDATKTSGLALLKLVLAWSWVGFATFPRIVWEARKLYFKRQLNVWFRPEIDPSSIGRVYTHDEIKLERFFRAWLQDVMDHCSTPLRLVYKAAHRDAEEVLYSRGFTYEEDHNKTLTLTVTTPAFYSRFVHYAHAQEAFDRECLTTDDKNRTAVIENAVQLQPFFEAVASLASKTKTTTENSSLLDQVRWGILQAIRCAPATQSYPNSGKLATDSSFTIEDVRASRLSQLDTFVRNRPGDHGAVYRRIVTKLFLAQRLVFGVTALVSAADVSLRAVLVLASLSYSFKTAVVDVLRPEDIAWEGWSQIVITLVLANSIHVWELAKG